MEDDDKDTYHEFFKREKELEEELEYDNYSFKDNSTQISKSNNVPINYIKSNNDQTLFSTRKHVETVRSDLKYETLYRRMLDLSLRFFKKVRQCAKDAANLHNMTLESSYSVCLKDINNWKRDVITYWKRECINRHSDIEQTFNVAFRKFMRDYYEDEDMYATSNTGYIGDTSSVSRLPSIFYNIPDFGDYFHLSCVIMTEFPDVISALILTNQASLESCVSLAMKEALFQLSQQVLRTIESREIISHPAPPTKSSSSVRSISEKPKSSGSGSVSKPKSSGSGSVSKPKPSDKGSVSRPKSSGSGSVSKPREEVLLLEDHDHDHGDKDVITSNGSERRSISNSGILRIRA